MSMKKLNIVSAFEEKPLGSLTLINKEQARDILNSSKELFEDKNRSLSVFDRVRVLNKVCSLIRLRREELALQAAQEGGKPLVDSLMEIDRGVEGVEVAIKEIDQIHGTEIPMDLNKASEGRMAFTTKKPLGVVLAISAFNHPFNLIIHQVIPAIAVGCPVVIKPAMTTPLSCKSLVDILYEAGLPDAWCQMVLCENDVAEVLVTSDKISFLTFIGSSKVGWYLRSKLAPGVKCVLEHGGAAPVIIEETADLDKTIPKILRGAFYHAGQVCVSVQRIFVHKSIRVEFMEKFSLGTKALKVGCPEDIKTEVGPLILPREVDRVESWVKEAVESGAELICGGERLSKTSFSPTILFNPPFSAKVSTTEIFGPVVCVYEYEELSDAFKKANDVDYAFQAAIFTNSLKSAYSAIENLEGLAVMINDHTAFRVDWMPFGGYKESGMGVGGIGHSMNDLLIEKMFVWNM